MTERKPLYLCAGSQSSGSTLISWCFLQRADMDGILDARFDMIPTLPSQVATPNVWCKFTVACFRFGEVRQHYREQGYEVHPLLVVRDLRNVFNSLLGKSKYARNGITAEDPPIRTRLLRLKEDWKLFRDKRWPLIRYEDLAHRGADVLREACGGLSLPWDDAMVSWTKRVEDMADAKYGNATFHQSRKSSLADTLDTSLAKVKVRHVPPGDLEWLEREFADFNRDMRYPAHVDRGGAWTSDAQSAVAKFENTRRFERQKRKHWISGMLQRVLGRPESAALSQQREDPGKTG